MPAIFPTRRTVDVVNEMQKWKQRVTRGQELYLLEMARILREKLRNSAPDIKVGDKMVDYAKELRIAIADGIEENGAVCVYFENAEVELTVDRLGETALFFRKISSSPDWVDVLIKYGPWPAEMIPVAVKNTHAKVIARKARQDELQALSNRIYFRRQEIESLLSRAGASNPRVEKTENGVGVVVKEDVGYNVLRKEFGFDGEKQEAHWRPAIKALGEASQMVMRKLDRYILTGRESVFELPEDYGEISNAQFQKGSAFQKELAPFS